MLINLRRCAEGPCHVEHTFDLGQRFASYPEVETVDPVEAVLDVAAAGPQRYLVTGRFSTRLSAYCARCLESFELRLAERFQLTLLPETLRTKDDTGEAEMRRDEIDVAYYADEQLDVAPLLEEQVTLSLPMRFLCRDDCRGLCQVCGSDKNQADCRCPEPAPDPRLEALKTLLHE